MMIADLNVPHSPSTTKGGPPVSLRLGHLTALEHLVPFTTVRPLRYLRREANNPRSGFHHAVISSKLGLDLTRQRRISFPTWWGVGVEMWGLRPEKYRKTWGNLGLVEK